MARPDSDLQNLNEFLRSTFLDKNNAHILFKLFLERCRDYPAAPKKQPGTLSRLSKTLLLALHLENEVHKEDGVLVQLVMDHFEELLEILRGAPPDTQLGEKSPFGVFRVEAMRLVQHCLMVDRKKFHLMVSMSQFGDLLLELTRRFAVNDRFISLLQDTLELVLTTQHKPLIESVLGGGRAGHLVLALNSQPQSNRFAVLRLLRLVDVSFLDKCLATLEREPSKEEKAEQKALAKALAGKTVEKAFLEALQSEETFEVAQIKTYAALKKQIETYFALEQELNDRKNMKLSGSSIFSNNLMEDMELHRRLSNSVDSDDKEELENMAEADDNDDERNLYGGVVRRRKISEDNIKVGSGRGRLGFGADLL